MSYMIDRRQGGGGTRIAISKLRIIWQKSKQTTCNFGYNTEIIEWGEEILRKFQDWSLNFNFASLYQPQFSFSSKDWNACYLPKMFYYYYFFFGWAGHWNKSLFREAVDISKVPKPKNDE